VGGNLSAAEDYLRAVSESMSDRYVGDCLVHAREIHALLIAEGRDAWIGRLRKTEQRGATTFHAPLMPLRFRGRAGATWTTHYVCCSDGEAYDPLLGVPVSLAGYSLAVFGLEIDVERV
jgi:hypothetical protein